MREVDWTFAGTWPFSPKWFGSPDGNIHYVDEGPRDGIPVVMTHGNATWGYLWRNFIPPLVNAGYRVIVPDMLGFGRSDKPDKAQLYKITRHAERLAQLLDSLDLTRAIMVPQDWGMVGLYWAVCNPDRVAALAIMNTMAHRPPGKNRIHLTLKVFRTPVIGELLVKGLHFFVRYRILGVGIYHKERINPAMRAAYLSPHPSWKSRTAMLEMPRQIPLGPEGEVSDFLGGLQEGLKSFRNHPVFIAWPMRDTAFRPAMLDLWLKDFPDARVLRLEDAGHYLQEDAHERIVPALLAFLRENNLTQKSSQGKTSAAIVK